MGGANRTWNRRQLLHAGSAAWVSASLMQIAHSAALGAVPAVTAATGLNSAIGSLGRAKNVIYLFLSGGPSQYETFDPKPDAPAEIRGVFSPIASKVPGTQICELLPRTATMVDRLAIVRSFATDDPNQIGRAHV